MEQAHDYFQKYLTENISDADTLERMRNVIAEFIIPRAEGNCHEMH